MSKLEQVKYVVYYESKNVKGYLCTHLLGFTHTKTGGTYPVTYGGVIRECNDIFDGPAMFNTWEEAKNLIRQHVKRCKGRYPAEFKIIELFITTDVTYPLSDEFNIRDTLVTKKK